LRPSRRAVSSAFVGGILLHALAAWIAWKSSWTLGRGGMITWLDLPISLAYLQLKGKALLGASLLAGGLQWGAIAALLTYWLGRSLHARRRG
jgi:hypothetical protein